MIINSLCNSCLQPYKLLVQTSDAHLVRSVAEEEGRIAPCPRLCGGKINLRQDAAFDELLGSGKLRDPLTITGLELYQAVNGGGLPDEIAKDSAVVEALLVAAGITSVMTEQVGERIYLHELRLANGVTIHLSAGARGAQVLKITKER